MQAESWPSSAEVNAGVAERVRSLLDTHDGAIREVGTRVLCEKERLLARDSNSLTCVVVAGCCLSAGADWWSALWPAAGAELMMAAADVFDDVADLDPGADTELSGGVLLTAAAGLLALAGEAVLRVVDDGASPETAVALGHLFGTEFARAANGQAASLSPAPGDALAAYQHATAKSGPLGALIALLGARTATDDGALLDLYRQFGRSVAIYSQLRNDTRDVDDPGKADVRAGAATVPLAFAGSRGAPPGLTGDALAAWEAAERARIAAAGGLAAGIALAEAARLRAVGTLEQLAQRGRPVEGLRKLVGD